MLSKLIVPTIVTVFFCAYMCFFGFAVLTTPASLFFKVLAGGIPLMLCIAMIIVLYERYTEIKGGAEDDISEY